MPNECIAKPSSDFKIFEDFRFLPHATPLIKASATQHHDFHPNPPNRNLSDSSINITRHYHHRSAILYSSIMALSFGTLFLVICTATTCDAFTALSAPRYTKLSPPPEASLYVSKTSEAAVPDLSSGTKPVLESNIEDKGTAEESSWQENLDLLFAPDTSVAERQIVLYDLLSSGDKIQQSVRTALKERKVRIEYYFIHT